MTRPNDPAFARPSADDWSEGSTGLTFREHAALEIYKAMCAGDRRLRVAVADPNVVNAEAEFRWVRLAAFRADLLLKYLGTGAAPEKGH